MLEIVGLLKRFRDGVRHPMRGILGLHFEAQTEDCGRSWSINVAALLDVGHREGHKVL